MRRARSLRGAATVELAVTLVVLVPLTMYTLFLEDFLSYYLDWQEAIISSPWDFTAADFSKAVVADSAVAHNNRREFCDHTSAYTSFDAAFECSDVHHQALTAHQCWLVKNKDASGKQVTCNLDKSPGEKIDRTYADKYNHGGLGWCTASLGVQNYFIVNSFLVSNSTHPAVLENSKTVNGAGGKNSAYMGSNHHKNAKQGFGWIMGKQGSSAQDNFGVIVDPWAISTATIEKPDSPSNDDFYKRMSLYFDKYAKPVGVAALGFGGLLVSKNLLNPLTPTSDNGSSLTNPGDNPSTPTLGWDPGPPQHSMNNHPASGYNDRQQSDYDARKDAYLSKDVSAW